MASQDGSEEGSEKSGQNRPLGVQVVTRYLMHVGPEVVIEEDNEIRLLSCGDEKRCLFNFFLKRAYEPVFYFSRIFEGS